MFYLVLHALNLVLQVFYPVLQVLNAVLHGFYGMLHEMRGNLRFCVLNFEFVEYRKKQIL
jgi:hypothetical protein